MCWNFAITLQDGDESVEFPFSIVPLIGAFLGHTQVQTTQRYAHLMDDPLREATTRVGAVIDGNGGAGAIKIGRP